MTTTGTSTPPATIIPAVVQSNVSSVTPVVVPNPNTNQNQYYYGSATGLCWVQNYYKVFTGYGGQVHAFYTGPNPNPIVETQQEDANGGPPGSEINNINMTVQGTVFDVPTWTPRPTAQTNPMATPQASPSTAAGRLNLDILAIAAHRDDVEQTCGGHPAHPCKHGAGAPAFST